jgi:spectinomycin phosphotransferase
MRAGPQGINEREVAAALSESWGFDARTLEYAAVGAGSYHWRAGTPDGRRGFVTVDDLDGKLWLGDTCESVAGGLERAFETARLLHDHGLEFVVAPLRTADGSTLRRLGSRHTVALFPLVDGERSDWGEHSDASRAAVFELLAELHAATAAVATTATTVGLEIAGRWVIEQALLELDQPWAGGPLSEAAREGLAQHAASIVELLGLADRFAADIAGRGAPWVITHGEPHAGNAMRTAGGYVLVDWDTAALAPPERDLWLVAGDAAAAAAYARATGHEPDAVAIDYFRLTWDLKDLAEYLNLFRSPHVVDEDTTREIEFVRSCGSIRDQWAAFLD